MHNRPQFGAAIPALLLALSAAGSALALTPHAGHETLDIPLEYESKARALVSRPLAEVTDLRQTGLGAGWNVRMNEFTGTASMAFGGQISTRRAISNETQAQASAREVLELAADLLGTTPRTTELRNVSTTNGKWAVHFRQVVNGLRVHTGNAFVLLDDQGGVAAMGSDFFGHIHEEDLARTPAFDVAGAIDRAARSISATPLADKTQTAELLYVPAPGDEVYELRLAYRVEFSSAEPFGRWISMVDAVNGQILSRRNMLHTINVTGTSQGDVEDFGQCDGVATKPFENMTVNVTGGNNDVTDDVGAFDITHGGVTNVTVTAQFLGPFSNVNRFSGLGTDAAFSGTATPGTPFTINWTNSNSRADERDTFFHANRVHDFMKAIDGTFTELDYAMPSIVGRTDGFCPGNAWWDGTGMNYCSETAQYGNTGRLGNVIYHEFGHGVTQEVYSRNGAFEPSGDLHEGNSDILANLNDHQPIIGLGFFTGNCTSGIRNSQNTLQWPADNDGGHFGGQIIAGFVWDTWQSMLASLPPAEADSVIRSIWHFSRDLGTPQSQQEQVDWSFLVDDDDSNLLNGTPHYEHLALGAANHGFAYPLVGVIITHEKVSSREDGSAGVNVLATIISTATTIDPASTFVRYRINGGSFSSVLMTATANPNEFLGVIPPISGTNAEVEYYIEAADLAANTGTSPLTAPAKLHAFDVAFEYANLESGSAGWVVGAPGDAATAGIWTNVNPIGTGAQPEDDSTPAPGVNCFITGQCSGTPCTGGCTLGCNDIDGGTTTLFSPIYDLAGATQAKIKYDRWYSNDQGAAPGEDAWVVDVSNNGGVSWTNVENTVVDAEAWTSIGVDIDALFGTPGQVQLRFRASDLINGSLVEAAVDELRILADFGAVDVANLEPAAPLAFDLAQNQPNPFSPSTRIDFALPMKSDVALDVYDVSGRVVRSLVSGPRNAGRFTVAWDGRDKQGQRVSAGVYFYRLTANGETLTRKMTVLK